MIEIMSRIRLAFNILLNKNKVVETNISPFISKPRNIYFNHNVGYAR
jgi:hypothetical protein